MQRTFLMKKVGFKVPEIYMGRKDVFISHHCNAWYAFFVLLCFIGGLFPMIWGVDGMIDYMRGTESSREFMAFFFMAAPLFVVGCLIVSVMKNCVLIIHPDGIYYRRMSGTASDYTHQEIRGWRRHREYLAVFIHSGHVIRIDVAANNFSKLEALIRQRYTEVVW